MSNPARPALTLNHSRGADIHNATTLAHQRQQCLTDCLCAKKVGGQSCLGLVRPKGVALVRNACM